MFSKLIERLKRIDFSGMDVVSSTATEHRKIGQTTGKYFMTVVSIYLIISMNGWNPIADFNSFLSEMIPSGFGQIVVQIITMFLSADLLYKIIQHFVTYKHCLEWRSANKNIWVKGLWLHIHDKKKVRVGVVDIDQDFYSITVEGYNVSPKSYNMDESRWTHLLGRIVKTDNQHTIYGYYENKHGFDGTKGGMHEFDILNTSNNQYPIQMKGFFRDLINSKGQDISNSVGEIFLYRLTEETPYYHKIIDNKSGLISYDRLVDEITKYMEKKAKFNEFRKHHPQEKLVQDDYFDAEFFAYINDPFLRKLETVLNKYEQQQKEEKEQSKDVNVVEFEKSFNIKNIITIE